MDTKYKKFDKKWQPQFFEKIYFFATGIAVFIGFESLLSTVDFWEEQFPGYKVKFIMQLPSDATAILTTLLMVKISQIMNLQARYYYNYIAMIVIFISIPLLAYYIPGDRGFKIFLAMNALFGVVYSIPKATVSGHANLFPYQGIIWLTTGISFSGVITNSTRAVILQVFGAHNRQRWLKGLKWYFIISGFMSLLCIILHKKFSSSEFCRHYMLKALKEKRQNIEDDGDQESISSDLQDSITSNEEEKVLNIQNSAQQIEYQRMPYLDFTWKDQYNIFLKIKFPALMLFLTWLQTYTVFPGVMLLKTLDVGDEYGHAWSVVIQLLSYKIFDTFARHFARIRFLVNVKLMLFVFCFRFINVYIYEKIANGDESYAFIQADWFSLTNNAVFGLTLGFLTTSFFIYAKDRVKYKEKEVCGFLMVIQILMGKCIGSIISWQLNQ